LVISELTLDQIQRELHRLDIKPVPTLMIMESVANVRAEIEIARRQGIEIAHSLKLTEIEILSNDKNETAESSSNKVILNKSVFISYCSANKQQVRKIYDLLTEKGFGCWIDYAMQGRSQLFDNEILDSQVFIACCSNNYGSNVNCKREVNLASDRKKLIIPILVATCDPWPPKGEMGPLLAGKIYIDLSNEENFTKNIEQLTSALTQSLQ